METTPATTRITPQEDHLRSTLIVAFREFGLIKTWTIVIEAAAKVLREQQGQEVAEHHDPEHERSL